MKCPPPIPPEAKPRVVGSPLSFHSPSRRNDESLAALLQMWSNRKLVALQIMLLFVSATFVGLQYGRRLDLATTAGTVIPAFIALYPYIAIAFQHVATSREAKPRCFTLTDDWLTVTSAVGTLNLPSDGFSSPLERGDLVVFPHDAGLRVVLRRGDIPDGLLDVLMARIQRTTEECGRQGEKGNLSGGC